MPRADHIKLTTKAGALVFDASIGNLPDLTFEDRGRTLRPLHTAPWIDEPESDIVEGLAPVERWLSGDFFCAPFGVSDVLDAPPHGWSANSAWSVEAGIGSLTAELNRPIMGARISKRLMLSEDAPLLVQVHEIVGGDGGLPVAHHPMIRLAGQGRLCVSPKIAILTPETPLEPRRHALACGTRSDVLSKVAATEGGTLDLTDLPIASRCEDFATLVEAPGSQLGWTAILREVEDDIVFFLKDPKVLPVTMLWHSNAGRDYAPWSGRHSGVLGVEDGCAAGAAGHKAALGRNAVSDEGAATALALSPGVRHSIVHVTGAIARPAGWSRVTDIRIDQGKLRIEGDTGDARHLPFPPRQPTHKTRSTA